MFQREAGVDALQTSKTLDEQARADEQDQRERDLGDDENVARAITDAVARIGTATCFQGGIEIAFRGAQGRGQTQNEAGKERHGSREKKHPSIDRDCLRMLREKPILATRAATYLKTISEAIHYAHEQGILHRDLKPSNVLLDKLDQPRITDFGLAKLTRPETESGSADAPTMHAATEPGLIMGTAGYMSPEQVRGKTADQRSDIFSFGAILYEMISGKRAFHGETAADTMSAILKEEVPELSETARNVPPGLDRIVRHCLEKSPTQRFHSAGDMAFDLEALTEISATGKSVEV